MKGLSTILLALGCLLLVLTPTVRSIPVHSNCGIRGEEIVQEYQKLSGLNDPAAKRQVILDYLVFEVMRRDEITTKLTALIQYFVRRDYDVERCSLDAFDDLVQEMRGFLDKFITKEKIEIEDSSAPELPGNWVYTDFRRLNIQQIFGEDCKRMTHREKIEMLARMLKFEDLYLRVAERLGRPDVLGLRYSGIEPTSAGPIDQNSLLQTILQAPALDHRVSVRTATRSEVDRELNEMTERVLRRAMSCLIAKGGKGSKLEE